MPSCHSSQRCIPIRRRTAISLRRPPPPPRASLCSDRSSTSICSRRYNTSNCSRGSSRKRRRSKVRLVTYLVLYDVIHKAITYCQPCNGTGQDNAIKAACIIEDFRCTAFSNPQRNVLQFRELKAYCLHFYFRLFFILLSIA